MRQNGQWQPVRLIAPDPTAPRSYRVQTQQGTTLRRNRWHLRQTPETDTFREEPPDVEFPEPAAKNPVVRPTVPIQQPKPPDSIITRSGRTSVRPARFNDYIA